MTTELEKSIATILAQLPAPPTNDGSALHDWAMEFGRLVQQEQAGFTVSLDFLKRVQESLSDYCGELDWGNADMELMDEVEAMIVAAPKGEKP